MEQYISKSALVAEIERRRKLVSDPILSGDDLMIGERNALFNLLSFLDTLEVKEVDLEKEAENFVQTKEFVEGKESPILLIAKHFFKLGLNSQTKDMIEALRTEYEKGRADVIAKTLEWINVFDDNNYIMQYSDSCEHPINEIIEWYKNYINRE